MKTIQVECQCGGRCRRCGKNGLARINPQRARKVWRAVRRGAVIA